MEGYRASDDSAVDQWVSYAMQHATRDGFDFDLGGNDGGFERMSS